jgi:predicted transcriptional regulator
VGRASRRSRILRNETLQRAPALTYYLRTKIVVVVMKKAGRFGQVRHATFTNRSSASRRARRWRYTVYVHRWYVRGELRWVGERGGAVARGFGDLEAVLMDRIWDRDGTTTVREVFEDMLRDREIAYTTVMSTMDNLHHKGWLSRERDGKAYRYWPTMTREQHGAALMRQALDAGGQSDRVLAHFLDQISDDESEALRKVLRRLGSKRGRPGKGAR